MSIQDTLRQAVLDWLAHNEGGHKRLEFYSKVSHGTISRFLSGERLPGLETIDRLCEFLGLELRGK